jgi:uncharacterized protein YdeI (YjbR/CyaY-like superfamily)
MRTCPSRAAADYSGWSLIGPSPTAGDGDRSRLCHDGAIATGQPKPELPVHESASRHAWAAWLESHHASSSGVWLRIAKKGSPTPSVSYAEALEVAICFGWIDGQKRGLDELFWLQRFTPRGPRSKWSQLNRQKATELIEAGRVHAAGLAEVRAAQSDGRWDDAYEPQSRATVPEDFARAMQADPAAGEFFSTLTGSTRYAFLYRLHQVKTVEARARRIADYIERLRAGRTLD